MSVQRDASDAASTDSTARSLVRVAAFAGLIAVASILPGIPVAQVPITLQTLAVVLAGMLLGPRLGALAALLYLVLLAVGLPIGSGMRGGLAVFFGPSGGFLIAFPISAFFCGLIAQPAVRGLAEGKLRRGKAALRLVIAGIVGAMVPSYLIGLPVMQAVTALPWPQAVISGMVVFIPGDLIKVALAVMITLGVVRAVPNAFTTGR